jgi:hypothetical protein
MEKPETAESLFQQAHALLDAHRFGDGRRKARKAADQMKGHWEGPFDLGRFLVDAGERAVRPVWISEGIRLIESVRAEVPTELLADFSFNLGNAHLSLSCLRRGWSLSARNAEASAQAVSELARTVELAPDSQEARINLVSALMRQGRTIESVDLLTTLLERTPQHPMAFYKRAAAIKDAHHWLHLAPGVLKAGLHDAERALATSAPEHIARCEELVVSIKKSLGDGSAHPTTPVTPTKEEAWIWKAGLALNPCPSCRETAPHAFDKHVLQRLLESHDRRPSSQEVAEIVNAWHRTFSTARWTAMSALEPEHALPRGHVMSLRRSQPDALKVGLLLQAAVGFHSVFDQVAFGLNSCLHLGHEPARADLNNIWYPPGKRQTQPSAQKPTGLQPAIARTLTSPLLALYWLSRSLKDGDGLYRRLREFRNQAEHRVIVTGDAPASRYYGVLEQKRLEEDVLSLGRLAKAAMWYGGATISNYETKRARQAHKKGKPVVSGIRELKRA